MPCEQITAVLLKLGMTKKTSCIDFENHLKDKRKELKCSQSENDPKRQRVLNQQHMKKYKSTMEKKMLTLEQLMAAEKEVI